MSGCVIFLNSRKKGLFMKTLLIIINTTISCTSDALRVTFENLLIHSSHIKRVRALVGLPLIEGRVRGCSHSNDRKRWRGQSKRQQSLGSKVMVHKFIGQFS